MNAQSDTATMTATPTIVFEPTAQGGGSLWNGDNLLATLAVLKRTERHGRLSLRGTNEAYDLLCAPGQRRVSYRMFQGQHQVASAECKTGGPSAILHYKGQDYVATSETLSNIRGDRLLLTLEFQSDWTALQTHMSLIGVTDLPLIAFYLFVAYDLARSAGQ